MRNIEGGENFVEPALSPEEEYIKEVREKYKAMPVETLLSLQKRYDSELLTFKANQGSEDSAVREQADVNIDFANQTLEYIKDELKERGVVESD